MKRAAFAAIVLLLVLGTVFTAHAIYDQIATGTWGPAGNLVESRSNAAAARLDDGRVLFTGGTGANGALNSAELLTAGAGFAPVAPMTEARSKHTATKLSDGRVLIVGGDNGSGATLTAEIYDPSSNSWTPAGNLSTARSGHTASLLKDGRVLIVGGENSGGPVDSLEIFDPANNSFNSAGTLHTPRSGHAAALLNDERIVIVGGTSVGQDGNPVTLSSVEIYDPAAGSVTNAASLSTARSGHSATALLDGKIFVMGGNDGSQDLASSEIYDPSADTWTAAATSTSARSGHAAFLLPNNANVLIVGGSSAGSDLSSAELFEPWSGQFKSTGSMTATHAGIAGAAVGSMDGFLAVAGGVSPASGEVYHFATIKTDAADYPPGTIVNISGSGWKPDEPVALTLVESPLIDTHGPYNVTADASGNISDSSFITDLHDINVQFTLTARGTQSQAQAIFTDAGGDDTTTSISCSPNPITATSTTTCTATVNNTASPVTNGFPQGIATFTFSGTAGTFAFTPASGICTVAQIGSTNNSSCSVTLTPNAAVNGNVKANFNALDNRWKNSVSGNFPLTVGLAPFSKLLILAPGETSAPGTATGKSGTPTAQIAGAPFNVTVRAVDAGWNFVASSDVVQLTSSDPNATLPANIAMTGGVRILSITLKTTASQTITATDVTDATKTPYTTPAVQVNAGPAAKLAFAQQPTDANVNATIAPPITVQVQDTFGNVVTTSGASITLSIKSGTGTSGAVLACTGGVTHNASSGVATFSGCNINKAGTAYQLHAAAAALAGDSNAFNIINPDNQSPIVTITFAAPDGLNNWYVHSPVAGTVDANDSTTGNSNVTAISCTDGVNSLGVGSLSGIGTNHASGSISLSGEGIHNVSCTATDSAGNTGAFTGSTAMPVTVKIDTVKPSLSATRLTAANGNGWNNTDVSVRLTCSDATSGLATINATGAASGSSTTSPLDVTVTTEGAGQSVNGSCKDAAGNSADPASVTNINIDKTKPTISGSASPAANANGWNKTNVDVSFACTDNTGGSGVDINTVAGATLTAEGSGQSATNTGSCVDKAGNTADASTVNNINIDKTAPTAVVTPDRVADHNTWYNHSLTFNTTASSDALSGIDSCTVVPAYSGPDSSSASAVTTCTDKAGNSAIGSFNFRYDATAPTNSLAVIAGTPGANGWYTSNVTVHTTGSDLTSGIESCTADQNQTTETSGQLFTGHCTDNAGNTGANASLTVKLDKTGPTANLAVSAGTLGAHGWYISDVTVHASGSDTISGPVSCTTDQIISTEGSAVPANGSCTNDAGLTTNATALSLKIDKTGPSANLAVTAGTAGAHGWYTSDITISTTGTDSVSDPTICTANQLQTAETAGTLFHGSCTNDAGLTTNAVTLNVKLDKTAPTAVVTPDRVADHNTWYNHSLTFNTTASSDALSGIDSCTVVPAYSGPDSSSASAATTCTDMAGNSASASFNFKYDGTGPSATLSITSGTLGNNDWYVSDVTIHTAGADSVSGIESCSADQFQTTDTIDHVFAGSCTNGAGLSTAAAALHVKRDATPPNNVSGAPNRVPDHGAWYNHAVDVAFAGTDNTSGIASCSTVNYAAPDNSSASVSGSCTDNAGNSSAPVASASFMYDATKPVVHITPDRIPDHSGWYNHALSFTNPGTDATSGIESCTTPSSYSAPDSATASVSADCTDNAGNVAHASFNFMFDATAPHDVVVHADRGPDHNGWYNHIFTATWSGVDDTSNIDSCTITNYSAPETAAGDISGRCTDNAGNTSTYVHFLFKFDATGPSASLSASGLAGMNGWFIGNVTISAAGSDSVSDPTICTPDQHQTAETTGTGFNGSCTNDAGLTTPAAQLTVKLDKTAPTGVTLTPSGTLGLNGWYVTDVTIHTSGSEDISNPIVCTGDQSQTTDTAGQLLHGSCTNDAGLVANATDITVKRDATPPALTGSRTPLPNSYGWNNVDVTVNFSCSDATSGVNAGPLTPQVVSTEGPGQSRSADCSDQAGNSSHATVSDINIDKTPPVITVALDRTPASTTGWFNISTGRPTGKFICSDGLSGLAAGACPADQGPLPDGGDQSVAGTVMDKAGNSASANIQHIKVDLTPPTITITAPSNGGSYLLNAAVASNYSCNDATSGVASCAGPVVNGTNISTNPAGAHTFTVSATDVAGNSATPVSNTYNVNYNFVGFLQPIDNLPVINVTNAGRVIPVKWQLKDANGNLVGDLGSLTSLAAGSAPCGTAPSDVLTDTLTSPGATVFRFDGTQFIFNWQTAKNWTGCWQLVATFNDGTKQYAKFQLK